MTAKHIKVASACFGGAIDAAFSASLLNLASACAQKGVGLSWHFHDGDALIARARAQGVAAFLADPAPTHLLMADADLAFAPEQVFRLLDADVDFAAAAYPLKAIDWNRIDRAAKGGHGVPAAAYYYALEWKNADQVQTRGEFAEVKYVATGFILLRRSALARLVRAYGELAFAAPAGGRDRTALFDPLIDARSGQYLAEGYAFCRRWTDIGGEIWVDIKSRLDHIGAAPLQGDFFSQIEPAS